MVTDPIGAISTVLELPDRAAKKGSGRVIPLHEDLRTAFSAWRAASEPSWPATVPDAPGSPWARPTSGRRRGERPVSPDRTGERLPGLAAPSGKGKRIVWEPNPWTLEVLRQPSIAPDPSQRPTASARTRASPRWWLWLWRCGPWASRTARGDRSRRARQRRRRP
jgi:hypothetical protein